MVGRVQPQILVIVLVDIAVRIVNRDQIVSMMLIVEAIKIGGFVTGELVVVLANGPEPIAKPKVLARMVEPIRMDDVSAVLVGRMQPAAPLIVYPIVPMVEHVWLPTIVAALAALLVPIANQELIVTLILIVVAIQVTEFVITENATVSTTGVDQIVKLPFARQVVGPMAGVFHQTHASVTKVGKANNAMKRYLNEIVKVGLTVEKVFVIFNMAGVNVHRIIGRVKIVKFLFAPLDVEGMAIVLDLENVNAVS